MANHLGKLGVVFNRRKFIADVREGLMAYAAQKSYTGKPLMDPNTAARVIADMVMGCLEPKR
jgi:hypothetical protein